PDSRIKRMRGTQSVLSAWMRWPRTSRGLNVSGPSSATTQGSGSPSSNARSVPGVRARMARASETVGSIILRLLHVPGLVPRPRVAAQALCLRPLAAAARAHAPRGEGVPHVQTQAHPAVAWTRLPAAARAADAGSARSRAGALADGRRAQPVGIALQEQD